MADPIEESTTLTRDERVAFAKPPSDFEASAHRADERFGKHKEALLFRNFAPGDITTFLDRAKAAKNDVNRLETELQEKRDELLGLRSLAWQGTLKLNRRVNSLAKDEPAVYQDFDFLRDYIHRVFVASKGEPTPKS